MAANMTAYSMCCRLSRDPAQVRHAREQARQALSRWGLGEHADLAELIVSELATNAICHGHGVVRVCVSYARRHLAGGRPRRRRGPASPAAGNP